MLAARERVRRALAITVAAVGALAAVAMPSALPATPALAVAGDPQTAVVAAVDPVIAVGDALVVDVALDGTTDVDRDVDVVVSTRAVVTRNALSDWLDGSGSPVVTVASATIAAGTSSVQVSVPSEALPFAASASGAFLLGADVAGIADRARSLVTLDLPESGPTGIALTMPSTAPETETGLLTAEQLAAATADGGILAQQLAVAQEGVALGLDPIVPTSIAALGDDAPDAAVAWMAEAATLPQTYAIPYGGGDPIAIARSEAPMPSISSIPTADGALVSATLSQVPTTIAPVIDATDASLDASLLQRLANGATVVMTSEVLGETLDQRTPDAHATVDGATVLVADAELQTLVDAVASPDAVVARDATARVMALLATITREAPSLERTLVAALPADTDPDAALALVDAIASAGWLEAADIATALGEPPRMGTLTSASPTEAEADAAQRIRDLAALGLLPEALRSTMQQPDLLLAPVRLELLAAIGAAEGPDGAAAVDRFRARATELQQPIRILEGDGTLLVGSSAELPVTVENTLSQEIVVLVSAETGTDAIVVSEEPVSVTIAPQSRVRITIPVEVVAPGSGVVRTELSAPDGTVLQGSSVEVNAQPAFETILLVAVAVAATLLLGFGIIRSIRKRRSGEARGDMDAANERADAGELPTDATATAGPTDETTERS